MLDQDRRLTQTLGTGVTLVYAVLIVLANIFVDMAYMKLDPRISIMRKNV